MRIWALGLGNLGSMLTSLGGLGFRGLHFGVLDSRGLNFGGLGLSPKFRSPGHKSLNVKGLVFKFSKYLIFKCPNLVGLGLIT